MRFKIQAIKFCRFSGVYEGEPKVFGYLKNCSASEISKNTGSKVKDLEELEMKECQNFEETLQNASAKREKNTANGNLRLLLVALITKMVVGQQNM